jgi:predicted aconitase with swiveling domain
MGRVIEPLRTLVPGRGEGPALVLSEPLSFWGGVDPTTGRIIDTHHPQLGETVTGRVLVMPSGRGSSSSSYVLAEAVRAGTSPAAIVLGEPDGIVTLGAMVAAELYGRTIPVIVVAPETYGTIEDGRWVEVTASGEPDGDMPGARLQD